MDSFDVAVVGGGPGGYVAALEAAKLGCTVALIEADHLGGTCLNRGCIPSKTMLRYAEVIELMKKAKHWGIDSGEPVLSLDKMKGNMGQVIARLRQGIASMLKAGKIVLYPGTGSVLSAGEIAIDLQGEKKAIRAKHIIVATGSKPFVPPIAGLAETRYHTSDTIFGIDRLPESIVIVGGGFIGVEFATIFAEMNAKVTIVEMAERIVPLEDEDAAKLLHKALLRKGVDIVTGCAVEAVGEDEGRIAVTLRQGEKTSAIYAEELLVAVGRAPNLQAVDGLGLAMNGRYIAVNERMQTSMPGVYAVGDCIGGWQLAHVASAEGTVAAANAAGRPEAMNYDIVPRCIYTSPEVASVGMTEAEAKRQGKDVLTSVFPLAGNGKAVAMNETEGFVKIIADRKHGEVLGTVMVGPHVTEMITEASAVIRLEGTVTEWARLMHPHPTLSESLFDAANAWTLQGAHGK